VICKFVASLLLFYYYKLKFLCLRDEQAVYKQGSVHVSKRLIYEYDHGKQDPVLTDIEKNMEHRDQI
jgi:hypothetical protein